MSSEALAAPADGPSEDDYKAFYSVLASSARGRAFLTEHARRARHAETETLLAALARIETTLAEQRARPEPPPPVPALPPAATALAAVAAQAIAAAESDLPVMKVIKAGQMPPPARFAGDDFAAADEPAAAPAPPEDPALPAEVVVAEMHVTETIVAETPFAEAEASAADDITDEAPDEETAPPGMLAGDALAALLALSDEERLALFS